jgi:ligand-binding sensor domain-containing protein
MKKTYTLAFLFILAVVLAISSCSTKEATPTIELTATITPTTTPIPDPEWSFFKADDSDDLRDLAFDQDGYLWVIGYGGVMRWDVDAGTYQEYTQNDGLGSAQREVILVDQSNNVWVAADDGIYKFDGESWISYPSPSQVGGGQFMEGAANNFWLCGKDGLYQFNGEEWRQHGVETGLPSDKCYNMAIDADGNPWVVAADNTLSHYTGQWDNIDIAYENEDDEIDLHGDLHIAPNGDIWIASLFRVIHFSVAQNVVDDYQMEEGEGGITAFTLSFSGTPWMAHLYQGRTSFRVYNGTDWAYIMPGGYEEGIDAQFTKAVPDPDGAIWFMGEELFIRTMQYGWNMFPDAHTAWNTLYNQVEFADDGRLFFTATEGVLALGETKEDMTLLEKPIAGMMSNKVDEILIDADGNVYALVAQPQSGGKVIDFIQVLDGTSWTTFYESDSYKPKGYSPSYRGVFKMTPVQGGLLYKSRGYRLIASGFDGTAMDWVNQRPELEARTAAIHFIQDDRGDIWITHGWKAEALSRWDGESWDVVEIDFSDIPVEEGKSFAGLYQAFLSPQGVKWFAVDEDDQWLVSYDMATETWTNYPADPEWDTACSDGYPNYLIDDIQFNKDDMPVVLLVDEMYDEDITTIYEYDNDVWNPIAFDGAVIRMIRYYEDTLWVGTKNDGVYYRDDSGSGEWQQLDDSTWEGGRQVRLIAQGAEDDLWIATQESINLLRDGTWIYFPQGEDGFVDINCMAVAPDGAIWFGSDSQGVARYGIP